MRIKVLVNVATMLSIYNKTLPALEYTLEDEDGVKYISFTDMGEGDEIKTTTGTNTEETREFLTYLFDSGDLLVFLRAVAETGRTGITSLHMGEFLDRTISWSRTREGHWYWDNKNGEWRVIALDFLRRTPSPELI